MACILPYCILPKETKDKQKKDNSLWQEKDNLEGPEAIGLVLSA